MQTEWHFACYNRYCSIETNRRQINLLIVFLLRIIYTNAALQSKYHQNIHWFELMSAHLKVIVAITMVRCLVKQHKFTILLFLSEKTFKMTFNASNCIWWSMKWRFLLILFFQSVYKTRCDISVIFAAPFFLDSKTH